MIRVIKCHHFNMVQYIPYWIICDLFSRNLETYTPSKFNNTIPAVSSNFGRSYFHREISTNDQWSFVLARNYPGGKGPLPSVIASKIYAVSRSIPTAFRRCFCVCMKELFNTFTHHLHVHTSLTRF